MWGRLLCKQKRGPRIMNVLDRVPETMVDHFRRSNVDVPWIVSFLQEHGVARVELDNLLQGLARENPLPASLYLPYAYVTTTRLCVTASCGRRPEDGMGIMRAIFPCNRECQTYNFKLSHAQMPVDLHLHGNSQFYYHDIPPEDPRALGLDRVVWQPEIPL